MANCLQKAQHAVPLLGGADQDRHGKTVTQVGRQVVEYLVAGRFLVLKQLLHQMIVVIGERLQHGEPGLDFPRLLVVRDLGDFAICKVAPDIGALQREIDRADHLPVLA
jgi:hypothetical protein